VDRSGRIRCWWLAIRFGNLGRRDHFQTFADIEFGFHLTTGIAVPVLLFGGAMGMIGGFLPAARAARMTVVDALRAS
jgi:ABC-type antimicrobial peptide transport system permease subunit